MKNGKRTLLLNDLLQKAKEKPGTRNLLVQPEGWYEISYHKRQPAVVVFDECAKVDWEKFIPARIIP